MAKKKSVTPARFETAGWMFFLVLTVLLCGPLTFVAWYISYDNTEWYIRLGVGITFAGFASAFLTWITNSALQYRIQRIKKAQRRRGGKRK